MPHITTCLISQYGTLYVPNENVSFMSGNAHTKTYACKTHTDTHTLNTGGETHHGSWRKAENAAETHADSHRDS